MLKHLFRRRIALIVMQENFALLNKYPSYKNKFTFKIKTLAKEIDDIEKLIANKIYSRSTAKYTEGQAITAQTRLTPWD